MKMTDTSHTSPDSKVISLSSVPYPENSSNKKLTLIQNQKIISTISTLVPISSVPVEIEQTTYYLRLMSERDLELLRGRVASITELNNKNLRNHISTISQLGLILISGITGQVLHPFKDNFKIFIVRFNDGSEYIIYRKEELIKN